MESSNNTSIKIIVGVVVIALAGVGIWQLNKDTEVTPEELVATTTNEVSGGNDVVATTSTDQPKPTPTQPASTYRDGTYTVDGDYRTPEGNEKVGVTLTITNDIVTDANVVVKAKDGTSKKWSELFKSGYSTKVIGKDIDSISLGVTNGSSLTPKGFNDALMKIKAQAKV